MPIPEQTRQRVYEQDEYLCFYCGIRVEVCSDNVTRQATIDYMIPSTQGGSREQDNLTTCCRSCNSRKRDRTMEEYRSYLRSLQPNYGAQVDLAYQAVMVILNDGRYGEETEDAALELLYLLKDRLPMVKFAGEYLP